MSKYNGSIELISGLKQKNDNDFPLVEAHAVAVYEESGEEVRLDDKLKQLKEASNVSEDVKQQIINESKNAIFNDSNFTSLRTDVSANSDAIGNWPPQYIESNHPATSATLSTHVEEMQRTLDDFKGDNDELNITFVETGSKLYLHTGETPVPEEGEGYNIIAETVVTGGGSGGATSQYNLKLEALNSQSFSILSGSSAKLEYKTVLTELTAPDVPITTENVTVSLYKQNVNGIFELLTSRSERAGRTDLEGEKVINAYFDITSYLSSVGSNIFKITATYKETIQDSSGEDVVIPISRSKTWAVEVINMYLSSEFQDSVPVTDGGNVNIIYTVQGNLNKNIYGYLNGEPYYTFSTPTYGRTYTMTIQAEDLAHGDHTIELWCEGQLTDGTTIKSKVLTFNFMYIEPGNNTTVIRALPETTVGEQYSNIPIKYSVYKADSSENSVVIAVNGVQVSSATVGRGEQTYLYSPLDAGEKVITFTSNNIVKEISLTIEKFPYEIAPITDARLDLDFTPVGRTNQDTDFNIFKNNVVGKENTYDWTLSDNFDWVNGGWQTDEKGDAYFCVKAGTTATFNYLLFNDSYTTIGPNNSKGNGKAFKLIFKTANVAEPNASWLSCLSKAELSEKQIGMNMTMHNGYVHSSIEDLVIPYSEEDIIEFDLNIVPAEVGSDGLIDLTKKDIPMIMTFEDGTPAQPTPIMSTSTSFKQAEAVPITIGSPHGDVHIYRMKAYNQFLAEEEILDNFIADARNGSEMAARFKRNQIVQAIDGRITPESLATACPDLKIIMLSAPRFTNDKKDKVSETTIQFIHKGGRAVEDNWTAKNAIHNGQGTSSNAYGYAARNLELNMKEDDCIITLGDGTTTTDKITLSKDSYPTNYLNLKVNVASSEHGNNSILQHRYDRYLPYTSAAEARDSRLKNTMNFFNAVLFVQETGVNAAGEVIERQEFNDGEWHFYSIGNVGDSKKTDKTRTSDPKDDNEFCVEIMDWNRDLSKFPTETRLPAPKGDKNKDGSWKYDGRVKDELKAYLLFKTEDGFVNAFTKEEVEDPNVHVDMEADYYIDLLVHDDFSEDYTYGFRYTRGDDDFLDTDPIIAKNKAKWVEIYRFLTKELPTIREGGRDKLDLSKDEVKAWKAEFPTWVNLDAALYYYLFTLRYTMVDNRAKNSFWHWGKTNTYTKVENPVMDNIAEYYEYNADQELGEYESDYVRYALTKDTEIVEGKDYYTANYLLDFWDYDNDTALGIDNAGKLEMSYGVEDLDTDPNQAEGQSATYFRAGDSQFFMRLIDCFSDELNDMVEKLESANSNVFDSTSLINEFDNAQQMFPERLWLEQYKRVYKRPYVGGSGEVWDNALAETADRRFLTDMMNGRKKYQRRQYERNQDIYMSSKFLGMKNRNSLITLRGAGDLSNANLNPSPDATITVTPYLNMYLNLGREINTPYFSQRCTAGETYTIPYPQSVLEFIYIRGANKIQSLGDLSRMYLQTATLQAGEKLKEIILGNTTEGYQNNNLLQVDISSGNKILEILDVRNIPTLTGAMPVEGISSLRKIYAQGTSYSTVRLPNRSMLEEVYLSDKVTELVANNLYYLHTLKLEGYSALSKLIIDNCPKVTSDSQTIIAQATNLKIVRCTNVDWSFDKTDVLNRLLKCKGLASDGSTELPQSVLTGKVVVGELRQSEIDAYAAAWPELTVVNNNGESKPTIEQYEVSFRNTEDGKVITQLFDEGHILTINDAPNKNGLWKAEFSEEEPMKAHSADGQFTYHFADWKTGGVTYVNYIIRQKTEFLATFNQSIRQYTVKWWRDSEGSSANTTPLQEIQVDWGTNAVYTGETPKKSVLNNVYSLFKGWDKSSINIVADKNIYPIWEESNPYSIDKESNNMTAADIYGLKSISSAEGDKPEGLLYEHIKDGDEIILKTGYMPTYPEWVEAGKEVLLAENLVFDGTQNGVVLNDIQLFKEDISFTLAVDFEMGYKTGGGDNYLLSCLKGGTATGFNLRSYNNGVPYITYNGINNSTENAVAFKTPSENRSHRDICVIRKIKGDNNLYVYRHNRFDVSAEPTLVTLAQTTPLTFRDNPLVLGGNMTSSDSIANKGIGTIHYAKLWYEDLGDEECKNICSWIYDDFEFEYVGYAGLNDDNYIPVKGTFLAKYLLDEPISYGMASGEYPYGYHKSRIREWLNNKVFKGISTQWQQTIASTTLPCIQGKKQQNGTEEMLGAINSSGNYFYLPAACNLVSSGESLSSYGNSISFWEENNNIQQSYTTITNGSADRTRTRKNSTEVERYWTRTPGNQWGGYIFGVTQHRAANSILGNVNETGAVATAEYVGASNSNTYYFTPAEQLNVLIAFSI